MTDSQNSRNPLSMSAVVGEEEETNSNKSYLTTETKDDGLNETMDQPKFLKPGSIDKNRLSSDEEFLIKFIDSMKSYLDITGQRADQIYLYFLAFTIGDDKKAAPAIFAQDAIQRYDGKWDISAYSDFEEFVIEFLKRKRELFDDVYESACIGFAHQVASRKQPFLRSVRWPHKSFPVRLIGKRSK